MFDLKTKILVVDDMKTMRMLVKKSLKELGYSDFLEAEDGTKAWEVLTQNQGQIGLIISDWNMPNCTGLDLLKRVRATANTKHIPFVLLTAESEASQVQEAVKSGVDNYMIKPFTTDLLKEKLVGVYAKKSA